jgi:hypothetical protein
VPVRFEAFDEAYCVVVLGKSIIDLMRLNREEAGVFVNKQMSEYLDQK